MKLRISLVFVLLIAFLCAGQSHAFDKQRQGFTLGLGAGYGSATVKAGDFSKSYGGFATTFKIGAGVSENVMIYYSNRVVFFSVDGLDGSFYQGASSAAVTYFLNPNAPSFYFSGELGVGALVWSEADDNDSGFAWSVGAGFEFVPTWTIEANYYSATYDDPGSGSNFTVGLSWWPY